MRYVVYGAGAVGGVIGARLQLAGLPTTLVARGAHLAAIRERGLALQTQVGTEVVPVRAVGGAAAVPWDDETVVVLAVKSHQTAAALDDLGAHAPPGTALFTAQNGVANERAALRRFAGVYGVCVMQPSAHVEPGTVVQQCHPVPGILDLGRYPHGVDRVAEDVARDLRTAGFVARARTDVMAWKHRKLLLNLGNAVQACYHPGPASDRLQQLARDEGAAVLAAAGVAVVTPEEDAARRGDLLRGRARSDLLGSTWQSVNRGLSAIETDWLNGEVVLLGRLHGVHTPANELLQREATRLARSGAPARSLDAGAAVAALGY
ncbi:MAG TPA: 2-dehydropantoate 2-reductase N-terminal domain-containing protein [Nocardioides sp.]|nr:2-dehydropantoate 2-reductase N-terminal domain-containing protein [Nocardioides sp.]